MDEDKNPIIDEDIFFVNPDVKRGLGISGYLAHYHIICTNSDPIIPILRAEGAKIFCLEEKIGDRALGFTNSGLLLSHESVTQYIKENSRKHPWIIYFKPSIKLDSIIKHKNYKTIGNSSGLNEQFENKLNLNKYFSEILGDNLIPGSIGKMRDLDLRSLEKKYGFPFVIQFGHGWAGNTTFFVSDGKKFDDILKRFPSTHVRVNKKISGVTLLNNCCIYQNKIIISPPAIQLSGISELSDNLGVTCGREWPAQFIGDGEKEKIHDISMKAAKILSQSGYKGYFGLDFIAEYSTGKIYLSEINARLTASSSFYAFLEMSSGIIPMFIYHIASFTGTKLNFHTDRSLNIQGSQIIFRKDNPKTFRNTAVNYGVFKIINNKLTILKSYYHPDKLGKEEFIFLKKQQSLRTKTASEYSRMETKEKILDGPAVLKTWVKDLISGKTTFQR